MGRKRVSYQRFEVFSFGGGVQSSAVAALILQGILPKPDLVVMVDTEREKQATWDYLHGVVGPALADFGLPVHVVRKSEFSRVDLTGTTGKILMPVFTRHSGELGRLPAFCSYEWKRRVVMRWLKKRMGVMRGRMWLGISWDEFHRVRDSDVKWLTHHYPLIDGDLRFTREDCVRIVRDFGWPDAPKSSCWACPHMGDAQWVGLPEHEFRLAVELDEHLRTLDPSVFLHSSGRPLKEKPFGEAEDDVTCQSSGCWV